ncbi:MAG: type secretion system protein ImpB [Acidobacteriota bacterium]|jgi:type VI secretion system protein ImpB|nr:type secretion system protein ImpB [Acidobacteriota bacterium]MDT7807538.1 type secretion system protein ImpB [Acidobacteriota bacterium]
MPESTQHKLDRVRPPRVQITYDVEIGDAIVMKELPFIVGIMANLSGQPEEALPPLKERKYVEIDRDNFNDIMKAMGPRLALRVNNRLAGDGEKLSAVLNFSNLDDFSPINVLGQIKSLADLFEARTRLADLLTKLDGNDALDALLKDVVKNTEGMQQIKATIGGNGNGEEG